MARGKVHGWLYGPVASCHGMRSTASAIVVTVVALLTVPCISHAEDKYGAIAYSESARSWGSSYNYDTRPEAEHRALQECASRGRGCKVVVWFKNNCGALATSSNGAYGYAWDVDRDDAIQKAIDFCRQYGGRNCAWRCWSCNSR